MDVHRFLPLRYSFMINAGVVFEMRLFHYDVSIELIHSRSTCRAEEHVERRSFSFFSCAQKRICGSYPWIQRVTSISCVPRLFALCIKERNIQRFDGLPVDVCDAWSA